jgi:HEAT repeat protein
MTEIDLSAYIPQIGSPGHSLAMRELKPLSGLGPSDRALFLAAWRRIIPSRRAEIVGAMAELSEDNVDLDFRPIFTWSLDDEDATVRRAAIEGLWESENPAVGRRLIELLRNDRSLDVRAAAAVGLSRFAYQAALGELDEDLSRQVASSLRAAVRDDTQTADVRRRALESAGFFAEDEVVQREVQRAYDSGEQLMRESALMAMGRSMLPRWLPLVARELESQSPALRYEAARAAGEMAEEARSLTPRLAALAADDDVEVSGAAIWALGQVGGPAARRALQQLSKSQDDARRQAASDALEELSMGDGLMGGGNWRPQRGDTN